jgi:hypothetical protein
MLYFPVTRRRLWLFLIPSAADVDEENQGEQNEETQAAYLRQVIGGGESVERGQVEDEVRYREDEPDSERDLHEPPL